MIHKHRRHHTVKTKRKRRAMNFSDDSSEDENDPWFYEFVDDEADVSEDGDDHLSQDSADTQSEQSDFDTEDENDEDDAPLPTPPVLGYQARDGTFWQMFDRRPRTANPPRLRTGTVKSNGRQARTIKDTWDLFIPPAMIDNVVTHTNQKVEENRRNYRRANLDRRHATYGDVDATELLAFFGLLYLAGMHKQSHTNLNQLWATNATGIELFSLIMSKERFRFLIRCLRFDDLSTRNARKETDKMAAFRDVFETFRTACVDNYEPGEFVTCDEMLEKFRGQCPFRQYLPRKPGRYGLKVFACCDARNAYIYNIGSVPWPTTSWSV